MSHYTQLKNGSQHFEQDIHKAETALIKAIRASRLVPPALNNLVNHHMSFSHPVPYTSIQVLKTYNIAIDDLCMKNVILSSVVQRKGEMDLMDPRMGSNLFLHQVMNNNK